MFIGENPVPLASRSTGTFAISGEIPVTRTRARGTGELSHCRSRFRAVTWSDGELGEVEGGGGVARPRPSWSGL